MNGRVFDNQAGPTRQVGSWLYPVNMTVGEATALQVALLVAWPVGTWIGWKVSKNPVVGVMSGLGAAAATRVVGGMIIDRQVRA